MKRQPNISHNVKCIFHNQLWLVVEIQDLSGGVRDKMHKKKQLQKTHSEEIHKFTQLKYKKYTEEST